MRFSSQNSHQGKHIILFESGPQFWWKFCLFCCFVIASYWAKRYKMYNCFCSYNSCETTARSYIFFILCKVSLKETRKKQKRCFFLSLDVSCPTERKKKTKKRDFCKKGRPMYHRSLNSDPFFCQLLGGKR